MTMFLLGAFFGSLTTIGAIGCALVVRDERRPK